MLVLHIGAAKAGSTTLQTFLKENRSRLPLGQLEAFGLGNAWKIAATSGTARSHWYWVTHTQRLDPTEFAALQSRFWRDVAKEYARSGFGGIVASSEFIYGQLEADQEAIMRLRANLQRVFGAVKVIVYLRNQVDFVKSSYAQRIMGPTRETRSFGQFIHDLDRIGILIHHAERLRVWGAVFGWNDICPVVFAPDNFPNGSLVEDFCHRAGIAYGPELAASASLIRNPSPPAAQLEQRRLLNIRRAQSSGRNDSTDGEGIDAEPGQDSGAGYESRLIAKVSDGNRWLNDTFFADWPVRLPVSG